MATQLEWDLRMLRKAREFATSSKDPSTQLGCVLVSPDRTLIFSGYNGFPRQMEDRGEWYADRKEKYERVVHAEMNALIFAPTSVVGFTCYTYPLMICHRCFVHHVQAGISRFVCPLPLSQEAQDRWAEQFALTRRFARDMNMQDALVELPFE